jgi:hypothetical protein
MAKIAILSGPRTATEIPGAFALKTR